MNLAKVGYYFSGILITYGNQISYNSERKADTLFREEQIGRNSVCISAYGDVYVPQNLYIIRTVNVESIIKVFIMDDINIVVNNENLLSVVGETVISISKEDFVRKPMKSIKNLLKR